MEVNPQATATIVRQRRYRRCPVGSAVVFLTWLRAKLERMLATLSIRVRQSNTKTTSHLLSPLD